MGVSGVADPGRPGGLVAEAAAGFAGLSEWQFTGADHVVGDVLDLGIGLHRRPGQHMERLVCGPLVTLHQNALGLVDDRPGPQPGLQVVGRVLGALIGVHVVGGDRGVGGEPGGRRAAVLVEGVRLAGVDVSARR